MVNIKKEDHKTNDCTQNTTYKAKFMQYIITLDAG